ncbi:hypothetical protein Aeqsu_1323 [Aequorivita sublithincola DSM 14238]|uniref:Uncharacterized protein n=1 Tax=Aequorivita sublithincola (strain DSM 14238 / LMG 21431 / ACAM 643 / 9-3) TaxID=746697 RepID=I3YUZ8_AEQSU|nr:hypothetical protein [Aequorivita sublithincola]AFL80816.1 hypothetical protein Aeqsu_1323 [Aequorivita sublithincola DSM 14238]
MTISRFHSKSFLIVLLVSATFFISCKDKETTTETTNTVQEATLEQKKQALQNVAPSTTQTSTNGDLALNPAHGQPGHDCAIPVGAPLNGGGATPAPTTNQTIQVNGGGNASPIKASTGAGINPAHGQPGHRCDIKVGDPL